jgi:hypothetical protein
MVPKSAAPRLVLGNAELMELVADIAELLAQRAPLIGLELALPGATEAFCLGEAPHHLATLGFGTKTSRPPADAHRRGRKQLTLRPTSQNRGPLGSCACRSSVSTNAAQPSRIRIQAKGRTRDNSLIGAIKRNLHAHKEQHCRARVGQPARALAPPRHRPVHRHSGLGLSGRSAQTGAPRLPQGRPALRRRRRGA